MVHTTSRRLLAVLVTGLLVATLLVTAGVDRAEAAGVSRLAGPERWTTAVHISRATFGPGVDTAWVVSGTDFPDALAAAAIAGRDGDPVLLTRRRSVPDVVLAELARLRPDTIRVAGGDAAVADEVVDQLRAIAPVVQTPGDNRYDTAAALSREHVRPGPARVFVASGTSFPDALAAAPLAARWGGPVLLTRPDGLPAQTAAELARLGPDRIVVVGGEEAVDATVARELARIATVTRLGGSTRWGTAARVARAFPAPQGLVHVASGQDFPDALAIASVAGARPSPVLLTAADRLPGPTADAVDRLDPRNVVVVGGTAAVSADVSLALASHVPLPGWSATVSDVTAARLGVSWRSGCPVAPARLRLVSMPHVRFDGRVRQGELIVHERIVDDVRGAFRRLYNARFPIRRMVTVEHYDGDDDASMAADNTSAFNCRPIAGGTSWSRHAHGLAIDVNPRENPYVSGSTVLPPAGRDYLDRDDARTGMLLDDSWEVGGFTSRGFRWGGDWTTLKDWQHFDQAP